MPDLKPRLGRGGQSPEPFSIHHGSNEEASGPLAGIVGAATSRPVPTAADPRVEFTTGKLRQIAWFVTDDFYNQIAEVAEQARVSVNSLLAASAHAGLPIDGHDAARLALAEHRLGGEKSQHGPRVPEALLARFDTLLAEGRTLLAEAGVSRQTVSRSELIAAAARRGLPEDREAAAELVREFEGVRLDALTSAFL